MPTKGLHRSNQTYQKTNPQKKNPAKSKHNQKREKQDSDSQNDQSKPARSTMIFGKEAPTGGRSELIPILWTSEPLSIEGSRHAPQGTEKGHTH
ncbi:MAG: hypothetical protein ACE5Z5_13815, partial [Candidatus Bathyarchaeia archaeon]